MYNFDAEAFLVKAVSKIHPGSKSSVGRQLRALYRNAIGLYGVDALKRSPLASLAYYPQTQFHLSSFYSSHLKNYVEGGVYRFNITPEEYIAMDRGLRESLLRLSDENASKLASGLPPLPGI